LGEIDGAIPNLCRIRLRFRTGMNFSPGARREQGDMGGKAAYVSFHLHIDESIAPPQSTILLDIGMVFLKGFYS
jgi:hypothetical protein